VFAVKWRDMGGSDGLTVAIVGARRVHVDLFSMREPLLHAGEVESQPARSP
jgi:hypothetical protein